MPATQKIPLELCFSCDGENLRVHLKGPNGFALYIDGKLTFNRVFQIDQFTESTKFELARNAFEIPELVRYLPNELFGPEAYGYREEFQDVEPRRPRACEFSGTGNPWSSMDAEPYITQEMLDRLMKTYRKHSGL